MCSKAILNKTDVAVAFLDVDGFEHVANHFGYQVADEAIIAIGRLLTAKVSRRRGDFVARYGTNTFAIVFVITSYSIHYTKLYELSRRSATSWSGTAAAS